MKNKNVHLITTERESRIYYDSIRKKYLLQDKISSEKPIYFIEKKFIYITNDEVIREGDCYYNERLNEVYQAIRKNGYNTIDKEYKVILTNDPQLIDEGVQEISEEFLKELVKNPVDYVEVEEFNAYGVDNWKYTISFPPKENKVWLKPGDKEDIINSIAVKDNSSRLRIDVYEYENFIVSLGKEEVDIQEISFTIDEMKNIYKFLKQYYEE